ncbi:MAG: hypothetical protein ACREA0_21955 [bacterium]
MDLLIELIPHAVWAVLGAVTAHAARKAHDWAQARGQRALLGGLAMDTLFVIPSHRGDSSSLLPQMATDDFLAVNNVISAFIKAGLDPPDVVRDAETLTSGDRARFNLYSDRQ